MEALVTDETCAVIVEPVQGEGGVNPAEPSFIQGLRDLCTEKGILLILDEVQCGFGRTGTMMGYQQYNIKPDIVTLAKALGGGFPISALLAGRSSGRFCPGDHASTFGNLACAVGLKMMEIIFAPSFLEQVQATGEYLRQKLEGIAGRDGRAVTVRGWAAAGY